MKTITLWLMPILISVCVFTGCSPKTKYDKMLKKELASGVRYDSLFMGLYLGMPEKEFYTHCWELNKRGIIKQGMRNMAVEHQLKDQLIYPSTMDFYPLFVDGKIAEMPVVFIYNGWAPWNKKLSSDSLQVNVLKWYEQQYGKGFMDVVHPTRGTAFVKVNGNRRISIFKQDDLHVWAVFTDMSVSKDSKDPTATMSDIQKTISDSLKKEDDIKNSK
jgi:hypothetical protein